MVDTKLQLQQGNFKIMAKPSRRQSNMQIFTPNAVAAVRSTMFRLSTNGSDIRQETLNCNIELTAAGDSFSVIKENGSLSENGRAQLPLIFLLKAPNISSLYNKLETVTVSFKLPALDEAVGFKAQISLNAKFIKILASKVTMENNPL